MRRFDIKFFAAVMAVIVVGVCFLLYFLHASSTLSSQDSAIAILNNQVTSYQSQVKSLTDQLNSANTQIASVTGKLNVASGQIITLNGNLDSAGSQVNSLQNQLNSANSQAASLQGQLSTANSKVSSLQSQVDDANSKVSSLQTQLDKANSQIALLQSPSIVSNLQSQLDAANAQIAENQKILGLLASTNVANALPISQNAGKETQVASFTANYAGYVAIGGRSSTASGYIRLEDTFEGYVSNIHYSFNTGDILKIPVLPGTVTIYYGNTDSSGSPTATITAVYYY
jgi:peptidoglycan hydrolase CwlO-like protein